MSAGACAGDFDGDGWADLFVTRLNEPNLLYRNLQNGSCQEVGGATHCGENMLSFRVANQWFRRTPRGFGTTS